MITKKDLTVAYPIAAQASLKRKTVLIIAAFFLACTRVPLKDRAQALRLATTRPPLTDDLPLEPLIQGIREQINVLEKASDSRFVFTFGEVTFPRETYLLSLKALVSRYENLPSAQTFYDAVEELFDFYEVYGADRWGEILLTSYFEPEIPGSLTPTSRFTQPLYRVPEDLIEVLLPRSETRFADAGAVRGRLVRHPHAPNRFQVIPYHTREEIDGRHALKSKKLAFVWVDPIDAFFLHIQGSGTILLENGKTLRVGYADQNGHGYEPIGKFLKDQIPIEKITLHTLENHLRGLSLPDAARILYKNPSYIFFRELSQGPVTSLGTNVIAGRTLAADSRFFPKGSLAFLTFEKPRFLNTQATEPEGWASTSRFVLDQDTGGAIRGGGRADLFWGKGGEAKQSAGVIKQPARLYYLAPRLKAP